MKITINNHDYDFTLNGTVGLVYMAEHILGEKFDHSNRYHMLTLYYTCLQVSNPDKELPDMMQFFASLTSATLNQITEYFWTRWRELEPEHNNPEQQQEENPQGEE